MEPEGVVDVLRRLLEALRPGGGVVDLLSVPPPRTVEVEGAIIGELDQTTFFPRAQAAAAGLDALAAEGVLTSGHQERFPILIRYPTGADAVEDVGQSTYTRMPHELARHLEAIPGPVVIRESCLVRTFRTSRRRAQK
jgi:hypothetical protein